MARKIAYEFPVSFTINETDLEVLQLLGDLTSNGEEPTISSARVVAGKLRMSISTVRRSCKSLSAQGLITVRDVYLHNGGRDANEYGVTLFGAKTLLSQGILLEDGKTAIIAPIKRRKVGKGRKIVRIGGKPVGRKSAASKKAAQTGAKKRSAGEKPTAATRKSAGSGNAGALHAAAADKSPSTSTSLTAPSTVPATRKSAGSTAPVVGQPAGSARSAAPSKASAARKSAGSKGSASDGSAASKVAASGQLPVSKLVPKRLGNK